MTDQYRRVVDDTESSIEDQLTGVQFDGTEINVSIEDFARVEIHLEKPDDTVITDDTSGSVVVENSTEGKVRYDFASGDLDQSGRYRYEWEVEFGDGGILTFPGDGLAELFVRDDLG